jgi:hypothetical protein
LTEPTDYDGAWKQALERFLPQFLTLTFPEVAAVVDWSAEFRFLDTELQQVVWDAELGVVRADKLVEVGNLDGHSQWLLIHLEVQSQRDDTLPERMFRYHYRLLDRFNRAITSLVVLADAQPNWRPSAYESRSPGCWLRFEFGVCKLTELDLAPALAAANPVARVIQAHRVAQGTSGDGPGRRRAKLALIRELVESGLPPDDIHEVLRLIYWLLALPKPEELRFRQGMRDVLGEKHTKYISTYDRLVREEGREEGRKEGLDEGRQHAYREMVLNLAKCRFGKVPDAWVTTLGTITDDAELRRLVQTAATAPTIQGLVGSRGQ